MKKHEAKTVKKSIFELIPKCWSTQNADLAPFKSVENTFADGYGYKEMLKMTGCNKQKI